MRRKIEKVKYKMNLYCIKCSKFTKTDNVKTKGKIDGKINICSRCIDF